MQYISFPLIDVLVLSTHRMIFQETNFGVFKKDELGSKKVYKNEDHFLQNFLNLSYPWVMDIQKKSSGIHIL